MNQYITVWFYNVYFVAAEQLIVSTWQKLQGKTAFEIAEKMKMFRFIFSSNVNQTIKRKIFHLFRYNTGTETSAAGDKDT